MTGKESVEKESHAISDARRCGEAEAEVLNLRLQLKESLAREARLVERTVQAEEVVENALATEHELRLQIGRYADFHRAVLHSGAWRLIQFLRRLVGREW
ncbi:MAG TPA: hypothetical protein VGA31_00110 [Thermoanaerobaculia bacterium]